MMEERLQVGTLQGYQPGRTFASWTEPIRTNETRRDDNPPYRKNDKVNSYEVM